jgi:hypothetical protein
VIVVIGMNPNKQYLVSPIERADLVRRMLLRHDEKNLHAKLDQKIRIEGRFPRKLDHGFRSLFLTYSRYYHVFHMNRSSHVIHHRSSCVGSTGYTVIL